MDLKAILRPLQSCPCGRTHSFVTETVRVENGLVSRVGAALGEAGFPKRILLVSDENAMQASPGLLESLLDAGFSVEQKLWPDMKYARIEQVRELEALCPSVDGVLSVGTGSVNDICRVAAHRAGKAFAIFATAPSMDGFASDTAPIVEGNFKTSLKAEQPSVILADTAVLAAAPAELKAAGFGDMVAKYLAMAEWRIANLLIGEYYCPAVERITADGLARVVALADRVQSDDEEAVAGIMEGLILTGLAMKLGGCSRPASGAEHVLSHYWECYKLARGIFPEYHGKKVGVATVLLNRIYRNIALRVEKIDPVPDPTDWQAVYRAFDESQHADVKKLNTPTITDAVDPAKLKALWPEIRRILLEVLPDDAQLLSLMQAAGAVTTPEEVNVSQELLENGLRYHAYMRYRLLLTRLLPMLRLDVMDFIK